MAAVEKANERDPIPVILTANSGYQNLGQIALNLLQSILEIQQSRVLEMDISDETLEQYDVCYENYLQFHRDLPKALSVSTIARTAFTKISARKEAGDIFFKDIMENISAQNLPVVGKRRAIFTP